MSQKPGEKKMQQPDFGKSDKCILHRAVDLNDASARWQDIKIDGFA